MMIKRPEILSPAGDMESLQACVTYGADAVYIGAQSFGMRASAKNFTWEQIKDAVIYCHAADVKLYLTCNTLPSNAQAELLPEFIERAVWAGVDALIVADIGIMMMAKRLAPDLDIHISTQCGIVNHVTATELYHLGASRVVMARELSLKEIQEIREKTPPALEIEAFVHGAMCMAFSGRCLLSQYMVGRNANQGECAQPCRWGYHLMEEKRPGQYFPIFEDAHGSYIMNAKDLCMIEYIDQLANAGIYSFKIEGRGKSAYYAATITNAYRKAMDLFLEAPQHFTLPSWLLEETKKVSHRKYSTGFYFANEPPEQNYESSGYVRTWDMVANVTGWQDGMLLCIERNRFAVGDQLEIMRPDGASLELQVESILDADGIPVEIACHPMREYRIPCKTKIKSGSILRKKMKSSQ